MKRLLFQLMLIVASSISFSGCRELAQNGDLSGQWQITAIDLKDGTSVDPEGNYYYCFYRNVCQLTNTNTTRITANMVYDEKAATITLEFPRDNPSTLSGWGLSEADLDTETSTIRIAVNSLSSSRLIMTTPAGTTISCRKY